MVPINTWWARVSCGRQKHVQFNLDPWEPVIMSRTGTKLLQWEPNRETVPQGCVSSAHDGWVVAGYTFTLLGCGLWLVQRMACLAIAAAMAGGLFNFLLFFRNRRIFKSDNYNFIFSFVRYILSDYVYTGIYIKLVGKWLRCFNFFIFIVLTYVLENANAIFTFYITNSPGCSIQKSL